MFPSAGQRYWRRYSSRAQSDKDTAAPLYGMEPRSVVEPAGGTCFIYILVSIEAKHVYFRYTRAMNGRPHLAPKSLPTERRIAGLVQQILSDCLPPGWSMRADREPVSRRTKRIDLQAEITAPAGEKLVLVFEIKRRLQPRLVNPLAERLRITGTDILPPTVPLVAAGYLSPRARQLLEAAKVAYIDTTGNMHVQASTPGIFISTTGADRDPWPRPGDLQSLKGRGAGVAARAIIDKAPPFGVRQLADTSRASAPTISRVLALMERDGIIRRMERGPVLAVDWESAIRCWAQDYDQLRSNHATAFLEPRGIAMLYRKLSSAAFRYAATGSFAAQGFDPIAPARTATLYVDDVTGTADRLGLREVDIGGNTILLEPFHEVVFDGIVERQGLRCVAPSQLAVDLLTGPGREPSQAQEMIRWMKENEDVWRS